MGEAHKHIAYTIERAERVLGYDPKVGYREGYRRALEWCFEKGVLERKTGKRKAVFFDRDGVLVKSFLRDGKAAAPLSEEEFEIDPEAGVLLKTLHDQGYLLFVATNQPDIARKKLDPDVLDAMHRRLRDALGGKDILSEIYFCPHDNGDGCDCRKPKPGLLRRAAAEWGLDLGKSFFIGDHARDVGAGRAAGCRTVLIRKDYNQGTKADMIANSLGDAVGQILAFGRA
ncbi:MAG: HAD-IIIA family hydrolase [Candidatus Omnitrophica bacterium]|nr:HAD-IIIA family hydrolase [Candidatus Omnitrophota bacterium]